MPDRWNAWCELPPGTPILARPAEKAAFLAFTHASGQLTSLRFLDSDSLSGTFRDGVLPWMKRRFAIGYDHAERILPWVDSVDETAVYSDDGLRSLQEWRKAMREEGWYLPASADLPGGPRLLAMNRREVPYSFLRRGNRFLWSWKPMIGELNLWQCEDAASQAHAVVEMIAEALAAGRSPESLAVLNATSADQTRMNLEAGLYGFSFTEDQNVPLSRFPRILRFLKRLDREPLETLLSSLGDSPEETDRRADAVLIGILNRYGVSVLADDQDLLRHEIRKASLPVPGLSGAVRWIGREDLVPDRDIRYYWMNYTDDDVLSLEKDADFLSDGQKALLGIPTSIDVNAWRREEAVFQLESVPDLVLFHPKKSQGRLNRMPQFTLSRPIAAAEYHLSARPLSRSKDWDELLYAKRRHAWDRYGIRSEDFGLLKKTFPIPPLPYDAQFRGLRTEQTQSFLSRGVTLSPTSLGTFQQCRFRFFLQYLLKIGPRETSLELSLGNLTHHVLSQVFSDAVSVQDSAETYLASDDFLAGDPTAAWLARRYTERLDKVVAFLKERRSHSPFADFSAETAYSYLFPDHPGFRVMGKIDLVRTLVAEAGTYVVVIDYKTGHPTFSEEDFRRGLDLQLVFYLHLLEKTGAIPDMIPAGFYYQPVNLGKLPRSPRDPLKEKLKMNGMTLRSKSLVAALDPDGDIRGLKLKADGDFPLRAKVADLDAMKEYLSQMESWIRQAVGRIETGDFAITPIPTRPEEEESESCVHCPFQGICYLANSTPTTESEAEAEGDVLDGMDS